MTRELTLASALAALVALSCGTETVVAQTPCDAIKASKPTAQERVVQREIQEAIDETLEAHAARDLDAAFRHSTPDFTLKLLDGTSLNLQEVREGARQQYQSILRVSDETSVTVECLVLKGKEAIVYTNQHYVRTLPDRKDGSPHEVITNAKHRETWVYTENGWTTKRVEEIEQGPTYLDGEPYEP